MTNSLYILFFGERIQNIFDLNHFLAFTCRFVEYTTSETFVSVVAVQGLVLYCLY